MKAFHTLFPALCLLVLLLAPACTCDRPTTTVPEIKGLSLEELQNLRTEILDRHADSSELSAQETALVERIRDQERRLENAWIFGEWRERHGARLIFRDDGTVNVGSRSGYYDELGVYKFYPADKPSYETVWKITLDAAGDPVALVTDADGGTLLYPFHRSRNTVSEYTGDMLTAVETGCLFKKTQY